MQLAAAEWIGGQRPNPIEPFVKALALPQRLVEPATQLTSAQWRRRFPYQEADQVISPGGLRRETQTAARRRVQVHEGLRVLDVQPQQPRLQSQMDPLGIAEERTRRRQRLGPLVAPIGRQRLDAKHHQEAIDGGAGIEV